MSTKTRPGEGRLIVTLIIAFVMLCVVAPLLMRVFLIEAFRTPAGSMLPTLQIGDNFFVYKRLRTAERGAVVVFDIPREPKEKYVKRIVGVGGDTVAVRGGTVFVNELPLEKKSLGRQTQWDKEGGEWHAFEADVFEEQNGDAVYRVLEDPNGHAEDFGPVTVPAEHFFVLGDNRDHSFDSRSWGVVPDGNITGRAGPIWYSYGPEGLRSERFFTSTQ